MKLNIFLVSLFTITTAFVNGQNKIQGHILDKITNEPLLYATIGALGLQYGCYTDTSGFFTLYYKNEKDSLKISYLGYKNINTTVHNLLNNSKILLEPNTVQLKEFVVKPSKYKTIEIGFFNKNSKGFILPPYALNIQSTFIPFPNEGNHVVIKSIRFKYKLATYNSPIRIRLLNVNNNGEPGEDILTENIIFNNYKKNNKQIAIIDISKFNVIMPHEGIFIAFEWIEHNKILSKYNEQEIKYGPWIGTVNSGALSNSNWVNCYNQSKWRQLSLPFTFAIGLTVMNYYD